MQGFDLYFHFFNSMVNHHLYTVQTSITVIIHSIPANKGRWVTILTAHFIVFAWRNPIHIFNFQLIYFTYLIFRYSFLGHFKVNIPNILLNRWYIGLLHSTNKVVSSTKYRSVWQKNQLKFSIRSNTTFRAMRSLLRLCPISTVSSWNMSSSIAWTSFKQVSTFLKLSAVNPLNLKQQIWWCHIQSSKCLNDKSEWASGYQ